MRRNEYALYSRMTELLKLRLSIFGVIDNTACLAGFAQ